MRSGLASADAKSFSHAEQMGQDLATRALGSYACGMTALGITAILLSVPAGKPQQRGNSRFRGATAGQGHSRQAAAALNPSGVHFREVTEQAGIHFHHERAASDEKLYLETMGAGVAWVDYKQDGFMDLFFVNSGWTPFF